jgi:hypothetical protein
VRWGTMLARAVSSKREGVTKMTPSDFLTKSSHEKDSWMRQVSDHNSVISARSSGVETVKANTTSSKGGCPGGE